jgi:hypothetical protein
MLEAAARSDSERRQEAPGVGTIGPATVQVKAFFLLVTHIVYLHAVCKYADTQIVQTC